MIQFLAGYLFKDSVHLIDWYSRREDKTTGGAGNTVEFRIYDMGSFLAGLKLPNAQALDPETKIGWEAVGVKPDIEVPADKALAAAHVDAIKKLEEKTKDEGAKYVLAWARAEIESELSPYALSAKELKQYAGVFGPQKFFVEGSALVYQREGRQKLTAVSMAKDLFGFEGVEYFRVKFTRDASGAIDGIVAMHDDGMAERNPKGK